MKSPKEIRAEIRSGKFTGVTAGCAPDYLQTNLVVLPKAYAYDFLLFCQRNPQACPLIEVTETGSAEPLYAAPGADLRTDLPRYCVYREGKLVDEPKEITSYWENDSVAFLLGCSFTAEAALTKAGIELWHIKAGKNVAMWPTSIPCRSAGIFHGPVVVSMRPIPSRQVVKATIITSQFPKAHGAPVHIGDPKEIGIEDIRRPVWGDAQHFQPGDIPVFWACGVTPQAVAQASKIPLMITHHPGHMFITDLHSAN